MSTPQYDRWSLSLGRWGPLEVRVHIAFLLFAVFTLYLSGPGGTAAASNPSMWIGWQAVAVLAASALLHELGHYFMFRRLGGSSHQLVLWPFGGVASPGGWSSPRNGLFAVAAGPAANLAACLICLFVLWLVNENLELELLHPLTRADLTGGEMAVRILRMAVWMNWVLFLVNLIPAYPFDGGHALYYLLAAFWPELEQWQLRKVVAWTARFLAAGLLLLAWLASGLADPGPVPVWVPLSLLAIFVFFSAAQAGKAGTVVPPGPADSPASPTPPDSDLEGPASLIDLRGPLARWLDERRAAARQRREQLEADEERRVDEILARLHTSGVNSLTRDDRVLLERVSARYRNRQNSR